MTPDGPRRVLLLTERFPPQPGGLARSSRRLALHAAASGAAVHVLHLRAEGPPGSLLSVPEDGIWVHRLGGARTTAESGQQAAQVLAWLHEREGFDLLHGQYASTAGFLAAYQGRLLGIASYVSLRGNDLDRDVYDPARFPALEWALRHAGAVGAVSRALASGAARLAGRADARFTPNSVDAGVFCPGAPDAALRASLGLGEGPVLGFAGELRHKKGAGFLLEAFRQAAGESGAQLLVAGPIRAEERRLLDQLLEQEPELAERVHLCPYVEEPVELARLYRLMDLAVCPSLWEGMPNFVLEAMACGRPVLASDAGGIPDVITHGETGWLLSRHQLHRLGEAAREALGLSPEERAAVGERARAHVVREFPPERERRELLDGYRAALRATGARPPGRPDPHAGKSARKSAEREP